MMPFATLFVSASANLVCEALGAKPKFDPVLSFHDRVRFVADIRHRVHPARAGIPLHMRRSSALIGALPVNHRTGQDRPTKAVPVEISRSAHPDDVRRRRLPQRRGTRRSYAIAWIRRRVVRHAARVQLMTIRTPSETSISPITSAGSAKRASCSSTSACPISTLATTRFYILTRSFTHDYRRESKEFEQITVRIKIARHNRKFVTLHHEIHSAAQGLLGSWRAVADVRRYGTTTIRSIFRGR